MAKWLVNYWPNIIIIIDANKSISADAKLFYRVRVPQQKEQAIVAKFHQLPHLEARITQGRAETAISLPDPAHVRHTDAGCRRTSRLGLEHDRARNAENDS